MRFLRYLTAAFWAKPDVAGLRKIPVNALAMVGVGVAGFFNPLVWVAGAAAEAIYLGALTSNSRFRRVVDAVVGQEQAPRKAEQAKRALTEKLAASDRRRHELFEASADRALGLLTANSAGSSQHLGVSQAQREIDALRLQYLKRMLARHHLTAGLETRMNLKALVRDRDRLSRDTGSSDLRATERAARAAELKQVEERLARNDRREALVAQLAGDLEKIEMRVQQLGSGAPLGSLGDRTIELTDSDSWIGPERGQDELFGIDAPLIREMELSFGATSGDVYRSEAEGEKS